MPDLHELRAAARAAANAICRTRPAPRSTLASTTPRIRASPGSVARSLSRAAAIPIGARTLFEIMGNAGGRAGEAFQALGPEELFLELLFLGDVGGDAQAGVRASCGVPHQCHAEIDNQVPAVARSDIEFPLPLARFQRGFSGGAHMRIILRREDFLGRASNRLFGRKAIKQSGAAIPQGDPAGHVADNDGLGRPFDNAGQFNEPALALLVVSPLGKIIEGAVNDHGEPDGVVLEHIVVGARLNRGDGPLLPNLTRQKDKRDTGQALAGNRERASPSNAGREKIRDDNIGGRVGREAGHELVPGIDHRDRAGGKFGGEDLSDQVRISGIVFQVKDFHR